MIGNDHKSFLKRRVFSVSCLICGLLTLSLFFAWKVYAFDGEEPRTSFSKKDIEVIVGGKKYPSLQAYKKEKLIKRIKQEVFLSKDVPFQSLCERLLSKLSPQSRTQFSQSEIIALVKKFYEAKNRRVNPLSDDQREGTEKDVSQERKELRKIFTDYMEKNGKETDFDLNFDKMKTITIKPSQ